MSPRPAREQKVKARRWEKTALFDGKWSKPSFWKRLTITQLPRGPGKTALLAWKSQLIGACFFNDPELSIRSMTRKMKEELAYVQRKERTLA